MFVEIFPTAKLILLHYEHADCEWVNIICEFSLLLLFNEQKFIIIIIFCCSHHNEWKLKVFPFISHASFRFFFAVSSRLLPLRECLKKGFMKISKYEKKGISYAFFYYILFFVARNNYVSCFLNYILPLSDVLSL